MDKHVLYFEAWDIRVARALEPAGFDCERTERDEECRKLLVYIGQPRYERHWLFFRRQVPRVILGELHHGQPNRPQEQRTWLFRLYGEANAEEAQRLGRVLLEKFDAEIDIVEVVLVCVRTVHEYVF